MLEDQLDEARRRSTRRVGLTIACILGAVSLCALILVTLSSYSPFIAPVPGNSDTGGSAPVVEVQPQDPKGNVVDTAREDTMELLLEIENEVEPRLKEIDLQAWNREAAFGLAELKDKGLADFASGEYPGALVNLRLLKSRAKDHIMEAERIYKKNMEQAASSLGADLYDEARLHIEKALTVAPDSQPALELQQRIERLPSLLPLLQEARVARTENDLQKELSLLQQLASIAPEREELRERQEEVATQIKEQNFAGHMTAGFSAIDRGQADQARDHYRAAKNIYPSRQELLLLNSQLLGLEKSLRIEGALGLAEQAIRRDDWQQARQHYTTAAADAPENKRVVEGLRRA